MNKSIFYRFAVVLSCLSLITQAHAASDTRHTVNILTWWGYLKKTHLAEAAEKECGVRISLDEYYSNEEFLRRWNTAKTHYDVVILSDIAYSLTKNSVPNIKSSTLYKESNEYNPTIKIHYRQKRYPHNIVYFTQSLTGFSWNPRNITLNNHDTIRTIFEKAYGKYVLLMDDPVEASMLIRGSLKDPNKLAERDFENLTQNVNIYITNDYNRIYKNSNFAFSYNWTGLLLNNAEWSNKKFNILIHPKLSYISSDLIAQTSPNKSSYCVAKFLSNKKTSTNIAEEGYYFSPYTLYENTKNPTFKKLYKDYISKLPNLTWLDFITNKRFDNINLRWQIIKIHLSDSYPANDK